MSDQIFLEGEELMTLVRETVAAGQKVRYLPFRGFMVLTEYLLLTTVAIIIDSNL